MKEQSTPVKLLAAITCCLAFTGCNRNADHTVANSLPISTLLPVDKKSVDEWSLETKNSAMDGQEVVATNKFKRLSQDKETKSIIKVALTCVVPKKELTLTMRALNIDANMGEIPTQFDTQVLEDLGSVPMGRMKSKASEPLPIGKLVKMKQDDFIVWKITNLEALDAVKTSIALYKAARRINEPDDNIQTPSADAMTLMAFEKIGIPNATKYRDTNAMFSGERPWVFEVSSGKDPFEITVPEQSHSASVDQVLKACDADPSAKPEIVEADNHQALTPTPEPVEAAVPTPSTQGSAPVAAAPALTATTATQAPSFDCAKAASNVEKMICEHAELAKADANLSTEYHQVIQSVTGEQLAEIKADEKNFIKQRNQCQTEDCVVNAYQSRRMQLQPLLAAK